MSDRVAVVGIACLYPDAASPEQLWENVLAGRRAFRRLPAERMNLADYYSPDPTAPDRFYSPMAAVIEGWEFDRVKYRIAGSTYRSTDLTHWLALDTVARALADAGFPDGAGLPSATTGVVIGNTLTGEFSRANLLRLRWPYVRRTVGAALRDRGWSDAETADFLDGLEPRYKAPFPPIDEDTLAGGLANTIAGRICNYFDVHGGGYTVDGACSSSLLSVATACNALAGGELDVAVAGGVDLSIDPFEMVGFAKTGALATGEMRVYDRDSRGFWPGEGCGMLVLMREEDAVTRGARRHAVITGWGYSSDGKGGLTRPEADGHLLAIRRAYGRAGYGIDSISYVEGHGTGTAVGDATELRAFTRALRDADATGQVAISTVKGNLGHTKAAAGVAGLLKAILAVRAQIVPPATGHHEAHPALAEKKAALRVPSTAELWPADKPIRAGVSAMGFGGINAHVVVETAEAGRRTAVDPVATALVRSRQDCEMLLVDAGSAGALAGRLRELGPWTERLSYAELGDLAAALAAGLAGRPFRAAVVASSPQQAAGRIGRLAEAVESGAEQVVDAKGGVFFGAGTHAARIGLLFPGQGAGRRVDGGALRRRRADIDALYRHHRLPPGADPVATEVAQPRIVIASVAGLRALAWLGITATGAAGHSLGELTALHWTGAMDEAALLAIAAARGRVMAATGDGDGAMAGIAASPELVEPLIAGTGVVIAGYNGPGQTVVSGPVAAVLRIGAVADSHGLQWTRIAVSHAFHSAAVAPAADAFADHLRGQSFEPITRTMFSTVTGDRLAPGTDVAELLRRQILEPVRFDAAATRLAAESDLLLEVGPGRILGDLAAEVAPGTPVISLETDGPSLAGLLSAAGAAYALGAPIDHAALFEDRLARPITPGRPMSFFANPAEAAPADNSPSSSTSGKPYPLEPDPSAVSTTEGSLELLLRLAAERAELPLDAVGPASHPLDELHLSSITVGQIVNQAARELGVPVPALTSGYATATMAEIAQSLDEAGEVGAPADRVDEVLGAAPWIRAFTVELVSAKVRPRASAAIPGQWQLFTTGADAGAEPLRRALQDAGLGDGVLLHLPTDGQTMHVPVLLAAARAVLSHEKPARFVTAGPRRGAAALAKTLHLEHPRIPVTVLTLDGDLRTVPTTALVADVAATTAFDEVHYNADAVRRVPVLRAARIGRGDAGLTAGDVLLVTGGGKGIAAECALALSRAGAVAVGLIGRSDPAQDPELAANLARFTAAGVRFRYVRTDLAVPDEIKAAVRTIEEEFGQITSVLHGAGRNEPAPLSQLGEEEFRRTLEVKVDALDTVLTVVEPRALRLLVTFGSIIGRAGLRGEAHYATANDWLTELTSHIGRMFPNIRCVAMEWSVWAGAGMGERLGVLDTLTREGITAIPVADGLALLASVLADPAPARSVVVTGRMGGLQTLTLERAQLPLLRYVDRVRVYYPGVELVVEADLNVRDDPYLSDHQLDGDPLLPAVLGMEAMAQAAAALTGRYDGPAFENVELLRPIVVAPDGTTTIRIAVLTGTDGSVDAVIRSADTAFQADHFRATLRYDRPVPGQRHPATAGLPRLPIDPAGELYGPVLFQRGRFRQIRDYLDLSATGCVARLSTGSDTSWFGRFHPDELLLADPGTRDAVMHALQCCVPDATLLPGAIESLRPADRAVAARLDTVVLRAWERGADGDTYLYDVDVCAEDGTAIETWRGLRLHAVRKQDGSGPWLPALLGPYLERRAAILTTPDLRLVVRPDEPEADRREQTAAAVSWALGARTEVRYRPDGTPEVDGGAQVSASHGADVTMVVAAESAVACDVEAVAERDPDEWAGLLGDDGLALASRVAAEHGESLAVAATRVWGAIETLRKRGRNDGGLTLDPAGAPRWVVLRAGATAIATFVTSLRNVSQPVVFTIQAQEERQSWRPTTRSGT